MNCENTSNCGCSSESTLASQTAQGHGDVAAKAYRPAANVVETADKYQVTLDVPGSSPEGIDVQLHEGVLSVSARVTPRDPQNARPLLREFGVGDFRRQFRVGEDIDATAISAAYTAGVLTVDLPKAAKATPRRVPVSAN